MFVYSNVFYFASDKNVIKFTTTLKTVGYSINTCLVVKCSVGDLGATTNVATLTI